MYMYTHIYTYVYICIYIHTHMYMYIYTHTHTYNGILVVKKNKIMPFAATWMDLDIIILSEVSQ